jgi:hypothetical protein
MISGFPRDTREICLLLGDFTQRRMTALYRRFRTPKRLCLQGSNLTHENRIDYYPTLRKIPKWRCSQNKIYIHYITGESDNRKPGPLNNIPSFSGPIHVLSSYLLL